MAQLIISHLAITSDLQKSGSHILEHSQLSQGCHQILKITKKQTKTNQIKTKPTIYTLRSFQKGLKVVSIPVSLGRARRGEPQSGEQ